MDLTLKEKLDLQRTARIITEAQYNKLLNEAEKANEKESADALIQAFKQSIQSIKQDAKTIEPQEEDLNEALALTFGLIASAPGILEALGDGVTAIKRWASGNPYAESSWGNTLKKYGHKLGDAYISGIASLLQAAFPDKYRLQNWDDKNSDLYKHAHGVYIAILAACAVAGVSALTDVHNIAALAGEGSLLGIKASEIQSLASKIAQAA